MTSEQFIKMVEEILFKNYYTEISIGDTVYFKAKSYKNYSDENHQYIVSVNRKAIRELCDREKEEE